MQQRAAREGVSAAVSAVVAVAAASSAPPRPPTDFARLPSLGCCLSSGGLITRARVASFPFGVGGVVWWRAAYLGMGGRYVGAALKRMAGSARWVPAFSLPFPTLFLTAAFAATRKLPSLAQPWASSWRLAFCPRQAAAVAATPTEASAPTGTPTHPRPDASCTDAGGRRRGLCLLIIVIT